jgi:hypothetical protein
MEIPASVDFGTVGSIAKINLDSTKGDLILET